MFSHDDFLIELSNQQLNQQNIEPHNVGAPLTVANRAALGSQIMRAHSADIVSYLEHVWESHNVIQSALSNPNEPVFYTAAPITAAAAFGTAMRQAYNDSTFDHITGDPVAPGFGCFHLIYALIIENTRCYEIIGRLIKKFNDGESLGVTSPATRQWITMTEAMFYRQQTSHDHTPSSTLTSDWRSDGRAIRRNAYYRMFGMDLNHGTDDNKAYPYDKPTASNKEFVSTLEALFRNLWVAITNVNNNNNVNPTDNAEIENLARRLYVMLQNRRINGTLTREEFSAVATMDWIRLSLSFNSPIVIDLRAQAESEYERLKKISERVDLPLHSKSDEYFELAGPLSGLLQGIESQMLWDTGSFLGYQDIDNIINNWSKVTGKVMKTMPRPVVREITAA